MIEGDFLDLRRGGKLEAHLLHRLDLVAAREYHAYNSLIAALSRGRERNIDWWVSRPATRNNHVSNLYNQCMQLGLIRELLGKGRHVAVMTDSPELARLLRQGGGPNLKVACRPRIATWIDRLKTNLRDIAAALFHCSSAALASFLSRSAARPLPRQPLTILNTFFMPDSVMNGRFRNPDYPGLLEVLSPEERSCCHFLPTFYRQRRYMATFRALRKTDANFILREDYLSLSDYIFAFGYWLRAGRLKGTRAQFAGFDIGPLIDADIQGGRFASTVVVSLLAFRFLRSAQRRGLKIRYILDWYEGMDINRGTAAAIAWHHPNLDLVGFRSAGSFFYMSATPAAHEADLGVMPKTIAAVGQRNAEAMQALCPAAKIIPGPGFRYHTITAMRRPEEQGRAVLVTLPMFIDLAREALMILAAAHSVMAATTQWWIKCHPGLPPDEIRAAIGHALPAQFTFVEGSFYDWLSRAHVVVGMGSSTLIEAVALGVPTICLASGNIPTEIPVPSWVDRGLHCVAYDAEEAADALKKFLAARPSVDVDALQADLLSPATPSMIRRLLKLDA